MIITATRNYNNDALSPFLSDETLDYHYNKHHAGYASALNSLIQGSILENSSLEQIILQKDTISEKIYNNAAQVFNHDFYWKSLTKKDNNLPAGDILKYINDSFGDVSNFYERYTAFANEMFGSGWSWVALEKETNKLQFLNTQNAGCPIDAPNIKPVLVIDLWEHAYYIDYRNNRKFYTEQIVKNCLNWDFANSQLRS